MCWVKEADRREQEQIQKELTFNGENVVCVKTVPLEQNATNEPNVCVFPHVTEVATAPPPAYNTNYYPVAETWAPELDLDLDRSLSAPRTAQEERLAEARAQIELAEAAQRAADARAA